MLNIILLLFLYQIMLHRRLLHDDYRGVGEPLNETEAVRTVHRMTFGPVSEGGRNLRTMAYHINNPPVLLFADYSVRIFPHSLNLIRSKELWHALFSPDLDADDV